MVHSQMRAPREPRKVDHFNSGGPRTARAPELSLLRQVGLMFLSRRAKAVPAGCNWDYPSVARGMQAF